MRKGAASSLDSLAGTYQREVLPHLLPLIEQNLKSANWEVRRPCRVPCRTAAHDSQATWLQWGSVLKSVPVRLAAEFWRMRLRRTANMSYAELFCAWH